MMDHWYEEYLQKCKYSDLKYYFKWLIEPVFNVLSNMLILDLYLKLSH